ncbi:MAG: DUF1801 domain-containing protein [Ferruginibacter sp.]
MESSKRFSDIDEYQSAFPAKKKAILKTIRKTIREAAPDAEEIISYNMPAFKLHKTLLYYAAHKEHIGLYPFSSAINAFKKQLANYKTAKGSIQFPFDEPLPLDLIKNIVRFRVKENMEKAAIPKIKKKK